VLGSKPVHLIETLSLKIGFEWRVIGEIYCTTLYPRTRRQLRHDFATGVDCLAIGHKGILGESGIFHVRQLELCLHFTGSTGQLPRGEILELTLKFRKKYDEAYNAWLRAVKDYSQRNLTFADDKFPAISGLARELQALTDSYYVVGLWKDDLLRDLLWRMVNKGDQGPEFGPKSIISARQLLDIVHPLPTSTCAAASWPWA
jgi:hypothetical protein